MPKWLRGFLILLGAIAVLVIVARFLLVPEKNTSLLPNPNGYDDFLQAAKLVTHDAWDYATINQDQLRQLVSTNSESLRLLRLGLSRQCMLNTDSAMTNFNVMELAGMKQLAHLFVAEGRLREMEGRPGEAALSYTDAIRFGGEVGRGGFIINRLVGCACEAIGFQPLRRLVPNLSCADARPVIAQLEKATADRVTWDEIRKNENKYMRYELSKRFNPVAWVTGYIQGRAVLRSSEYKHKNLVTRVNLLALELGLRCYRAEHGQPPASLTEIAPLYLKQIPADPFSNGPLIYHPQPGTTNWLLYSVGPDGRDDGGRPGGRLAAGNVSPGDISYDSTW